MVDDVGGVSCVNLTMISLPVGMLRLGSLPLSDPMMVFGCDDDDWSTTAVGWPRLISVKRLRIRVGGIMVADGGNCCWLVGGGGGGG